MVLSEDAKNEPYNAFLKLSYLKVILFLFGAGKASTRDMTAELTNHSRYVLLYDGKFGADTILIEIWS